MISDSVSKKFGIGFGIEKIKYRKKYRIRYRKNLVSEKSFGLGFVQIFGIVTHCIWHDMVNTRRLKCFYQLGQTLKQMVIGVWVGGGCIYAYMIWHLFLWTRFSQKLEGRGGPPFEKKSHKTRVFLRACLIGVWVGGVGCVWYDTESTGRPAPP